MTKPTAKPSKTLASYLGTWSYTHASAEIFYQVVPQGELYKITWGDSVISLASSHRRSLTVDAVEAFRRIRSKARGGYSLLIPYTGTLPESAKLEVTDLYPPKPQHTAKPKPVPKKRFSFTDWLSER